MGAWRADVARGDEPVCDSLRGTVYEREGVEWPRAWTLPSPWAPRTRPPRLGKPHRTRFPTAPTRIVNASHTKNLTLPLSVNRALSNARSSLIKVLTSCVRLVASEDSDSSLLARAPR